MTAAHNNKPMLTAERKGFDAYLTSEPCPYKDKRKWNGRLTWSRAYRNAWMAGYQKAGMYFGEPASSIQQTMWELIP